MPSFKWVFVLCYLHFIYNLTYGQANVKFFRKDYTYLEETESFYKIHTIHKNWFEAKKRCELEGATLFYPYNEDEAEAVINFWNKTQPFSLIYIGISAPNVKQVFETVDNLPIADVYDKWGQGEPNNEGGEEDCVVMKKGSTLNDVSCTIKYPFICKKTLITLKWNVYCDIPDLGYEYVKKLGRCYKLHLTPMNWNDAYTVCNIEQAHLAVINREDEAKHFVDLINRAPKEQVTGDYLRGAVHLGFQNKNGWNTIKGTTVAASGYSKWGNGQPDGGDNERCGSMFYNGNLNDISCDQKCFFICEHEVDLLNAALTLKFGKKQY